MNDRPDPSTTPDDLAPTASGPTDAPRPGHGADPAADVPADQRPAPGSRSGGGGDDPDPGEETTPTMPIRRRPAWQPALVLAAILALSGVAVVALSGGGDSDDRDVQTDRAPADQTTQGDRSDESEQSEGSEGATAPAAAAATVAVTYGEASLASDPADLTLRFLAPDGSVIATRSWSEVEESAGGSGDVTAMRGLVQDVPSGDLQMEATLQRSGDATSCVQRFTPAQGDRLILRLEQGALGSAPGGPGADPVCATVQSVAEWVQGRTSRTGQAYVGLSAAEAQTRAESAGLTTRVAGVDGMDLALTMDLQPNRLNLLLFDGTVVAAQLEGDSPGG